MTIRGTQTTISGILILSLIVAVGSVYWAYLDRHFFEDELQSLIKATLAQYAPPLSIVLGSLFAVEKTQAKRRTRPHLALLAVGCVALWIVLSTGRLLIFLLSDAENISIMEAWNTNITVTAGFLINAVLAYFFVKSARNQSETE